MLWHVAMQGEWAGRDFSIWGAGRDGRQFLAALQPAYRARVRGFCDIDPRKIARGYIPPRLAPLYKIQLSAQRESESEREY